MIAGPSPAEARFQALMTWYDADGADQWAEDDPIIEAAATLPASEARALLIESLEVVLHLPQAEQVAAWHKEVERRLRTA